MFIVQIEMKAILSIYFLSRQHPQVVTGDQKKIEPAWTHRVEKGSFNMGISPWQNLSQPTIFGLSAKEY